MNRRGFLASLIAVAVAPHVPTPTWETVPVEVFDESGVTYAWDDETTSRYLRPAMQALIAERDRFTLEAYRRCYA